jgi:hypothetical protein
MPSTGSQSDCWLDVFDDDYFMGRRRRIKGPQKLKQVRAKSLIVGPKAKVVVSIYRDSKKFKLRLPARRLVPELAKAIGKRGVLREVVVESIK